MRLKLFFFMYFALICNFAISQDSVDVKSIFKMQLFLDKEYNKNLKTSIIKNADLFIHYDQNINFIPEALTSFNMRERFVFYKLNIENIQYSTSNDTDLMKTIGVIHGFITNYILCVNLRNGRSYRIQGFDASDFLAFIHDYIEEYNSIGYIENITENDFLKEVRVEGVDFKCLYNGLRAKKMDRRKYSCLKRVTDPISIH